jgi:hypothetical protein
MSPTSRRLIADPFPPRPATTLAYPDPILIQGPDCHTLNLDPTVLLAACSVPPTLQWKPTYDLDQTGLASDRLGSPSKVTSVQAERTVLGVATADTDSVDTLGRVELGHGGLTAELELSLLTAGAGQQCTSGYPPALIPTSQRVPLRR